MMELAAEKSAGAAWKIENLSDYQERLKRAAGRVSRLIEEHETAAMVIYEAALSSSGYSRKEVRDLVVAFKERFEDEGEEPLTIPRVSGIMNSEGTEWFFGDEELRRLTGRLLGQFQHRVAQYNYLDERDVLKRWADSHDTRLFIRRGIHDTEPVVGVVAGFDLGDMQYLRVLAGGNTVMPSEGLRAILGTLGLIDGRDANDSEIIGQTEMLALRMDLPAPVLGEMLEDLARDGDYEFPEPPPQVEETPQEGEEPPEEERLGEEPTKAQDPHEKGEPEPGDRKPSAPQEGRKGAPGQSGAQ